MATDKEICEGVPNYKSCLDRAVSDIHIAQLVKAMTEWQEFAPFLGLSPAEEEDITERYRGRLQLQKRLALRKWKAKNGREATYQKLIDIFCEQDRRDLAETVKNLIENPSASSSTPNRHMIDVFHDYLHDCYSELPHPSSLQWPNSSNECYVELGLLDVPVKGEAVDDPKLCKPIPLKSLFASGNSKAKRKVILIEGIAGVGKTTLSWHACKEWAAGRLFEDVKLLVHVSLSDPMLHSASKLADLIPHPSEEMRTNVAKAIAEKRGKGVCFLLEGFDEAPQSLWQSFLFRFIAGTGGRSMLPDAHIILTSRPGIPIQLAVCLTGKVVIRGFNLLDYVHLVGNSTQLREILEMKPELYSLCHLPLNAVILVYLYRNFKDELPTTRTGLFGLFVYNFLIRHIQTRTNCEPTSINNFPADLPDDIHSSLSKISALAYNSLLDRKIMIDQQMFQKFGVDNAFGFLQVRQTLTMCGPNKQFTFIHLSLQEFLAAFHISEMDQHQQVAAFKSLFDQNPLSPVLTFYAGLTGLNIDKVRGILLKVLSETIDLDDIVKKLGLNDPNTIHTINPACDPRRHMLALMNGMYETQNINLFTHVRLPTYVQVFQLAESHIQETCIRLLGMLLYPTDCLAIGYFIWNVISQTNNISCLIDFSFCMLGDQEIKALAINLQKPAVPYYDGMVSLCFRGICFSARAIKCLAALISTDSCIREVDVDVSLMENNDLFFKHCTEGFTNLKHASLPKKLSLQFARCDSNVIYYLILLLRCDCPYLIGLDLSCGNHLFANPNAMVLFCEALKNSHIVALHLGDCGIDDNSLKSLIATVCHKSCKIQALDLFHNPYSEHGLTCFLERLLNSPFVQLHKLFVNHVSDDHKKVLKSINNVREHRHWPILTLDQEDKFLLRVRNEEKLKAIALLNRYMLTRPDLALQSLHH